VIKIRDQGFVVGTLKYILITIAKHKLLECVYVRCEQSDYSGAHYQTNDINDRARSMLFSVQTLLLLID